MVFVGSAKRWWMSLWMGARASVPFMVAIASVALAPNGFGRTFQVPVANAATAPKPGACPGNALIDPGFEEGFTGRGRADALLPNGWESWFERLPGIDGLNYPPHYGPIRSADSVGAGLWSLEQSTSDATHTGGVWQQVTVGQNAQVRAWAWSYAWASAGSQREVSQPQGTYATAIGIDPLGGTDANSATIAWTSPITTTDAWVLHEIDLGAPGPVVTLFTRGQPLQILRNNVSRWDAMCLRVLGPIGTIPGPSDAESLPSVLATAPSDEAATAMAAGLFATATARSREEAPPVGVSDGIIVGAAATMAAAATRVAAAPDFDLGPDSDEDPPSTSLTATILDHLGFIAVAGALFCAGVILGLGGKSAGSAR